MRFASSITSASVEKRISGATGPNVSSRKIFIAGVTSVSTVGSKNVPESALVDVANASFLPLDVLVGNDGENKKQFMISLRHGDLVDKRKLLNMLSGKIDPFV